MYTPFLFFYTIYFFKTLCTSHEFKQKFLVHIQDDDDDDDWGEWLLMKKKVMGFIVV